MSSNEEFLKRIQEIRDLAKEEIVLGDKVNKSVKDLLKGYTDLAKLKDRQYKSQVLLSKLQRDEQRILTEIVELERQNATANAGKIKNLKDQAAAIASQAAELELVVQKAKIFQGVLINATDVSKALTNSIASGLGGAIKGLAKISGIPTSISDLQRAISGSLSNMNNLDKSIRALVVNFGGGTYANETFRKSLQTGASDALFLGATLEELISTQASLTEKFGRNLILSSDQFKDVAAIARGTSLGFEGAADILEKYDSFGIGITNTYQRLDKFTQNLQKTGLNTGKVLQTLSTNLKNAQAYNFRDGIDGLQRMVMQAQRLKFDISDTFRFAEKLFTPEGAIETAAELQVLGGRFSQLADPFQLLFKARNDIEGLQKDILNATTGIAQRVGDQFQIPAMELQRLRIISEKTGLNFNNLTESILQAEKRNFFESQLQGGVKYNETLREAVKDLAQMEDGIAKINVNGKMIELNKLTKTQAESLFNNQKALKEIASGSQVFQDRLKQIGQTIQLAFLPLVEKFNNFFNRPEVLENIKRIASGISDFIVKTTKPIANMLEDPSLFSGNGLQANIKQFIITAVKVGIDTIKPLFKEAMPYIMEGIKEIIVGSFDFLQGMIVMKLKSMIGTMVKGIGLVLKSVVKWGIDFIKLIPGIGDLVSIVSGIKRLNDGDRVGGLIDIASGAIGGVANLFTAGIGGTALKIGAKSLNLARGTSIGLDITNVGRDLGIVGDKYDVKKAQDLTYIPGQKPLLTIPGAGAYELSSKDAIYARDITATPSRSGDMNVKFSGTIKLDAGMGVSREMRMELLQYLVNDIAFQRDLVRVLTSSKDLTYANLS